MPRSVNHVASRAKRKRILKLTRGYYGARKNVWTVAKNTWEKGLTYAFRDRRNKKRNFRALWIPVSYTHLADRDYWTAIEMENNSKKDRQSAQGGNAMASTNTTGQDSNASSSDDKGENTREKSDKNINKFNRLVEYDLSLIHI